MTTTTTTLTKEPKRYAIVIDELYTTTELETDDYIKALETFIELYMNGNNVLFFDGEEERNPLVED